MKPTITSLWNFLIVLAVISFVYMLYLISYAPIEKYMGIVQKIFYIHVPSAYAMYLGFTCSALGSVFFIFKGSSSGESISKAGAEVGLLFALAVLITGPMWGRKAWGVYWVWDPRLTATLLTAMIYGSVVILRSFSNPGNIERRFSCALAIIGFPMIFLIKFSVARWKGQHPAVITGAGGGISPDMQGPLIMAFLFFSLLFLSLMSLRYYIDQSHQKLQTLHQTLSLKHRKKNI